MLNREFVLSFREAAPDINTFRGKTFVLAVSGEAVMEGGFHNLSQDINLLVSLGVRVVLVHGIRPQIETLLKRFGLNRLFHRDRRVTDASTMEIVKQACGATRHGIEAQLSMGMPNSPMFGSHLRVAGGNFITAQPLGVLDGVDMQYTGQVRRIDVDGINTRLGAGELVLLSPVGYSVTGEAFNLTMEEMAAQLASALKAEKLIFVIEGRGVTNEQGQHVSSLTAQQAEDLLHAGHLQRDVTAYLPYAIKATRDGIPRAHLVSHHEDGSLLAELFTNGGTGTMIARDSLVKVRNASVDDIGPILNLIRPLEEQGILVKRSREHLEMEISQYSVLEHDGKIYGCVAMHVFPEAGMAKLACLAVAPERREGRFGETLLKHVEYQARTRGLKALFVLTTQTAHWFVERGFAEAGRGQLPLARQAFYNNQRRSKIFVKEL